jgi:hypothetical protein
MKNLPLVLGFAVLAVIGWFAGTRKAKASTAPAEDQEEDKGGTLPAVPGLKEREQKEPGFIRGFLRVMKETGADPDKMAALVSEETGFRPEVGYDSPAGPGTAATGLLGWIPRYAKAISGFDVHEIHRMSALEQLAPIKTTIQRAPGYKTDPPMQGWGNSIGAPDDKVIAVKDDPEPDRAKNTAGAYAANYRAYDQAGRGVITAGDVRRKVYATLAMAKGKRLDTSGKEVST